VPSRGGNTTGGKNLSDVCCPREKVTVGGVQLCPLGGIKCSVCLGAPGAHWFHARISRYARDPCEGDPQTCRDERNEDISSSRGTMCARGEEIPPGTDVRADTLAEQGDRAAYWCRRSFSTRGTQSGWWSNARGGQFGEWWWGERGDAEIGDTVGRVHRPPIRTNYHSVSEIRLGINARRWAMLRWRR